MVFCQGFQCNQMYKESVCSLEKSECLALRLSVCLAQKSESVYSLEESVRGYVALKECVHSSEESVCIVAPKKISVHSSEECACSLKGNLCVYLALQRVCV